MKYFWSMTLGCKDIGTRKSEFETKAQFFFPDFHVYNCFSSLFTLYMQTIYFNILFNIFKIQKKNYFKSRKLDLRAP